MTCRDWVPHRGRLDSLGTSWGRAGIDQRDRMTLNPRRLSWWMLGVNARELLFPVPNLPSVGVVYGADAFVLCPDDQARGLSLVLDSDPCVSVRVDQTSTRRVDRCARGFRLPTRRLRGPLERADYVERCGGPEPWRQDRHVDTRLLVRRQPFPASADRTDQTE
jgi:hypothetical protein